MSKFAPKWLGAEGNPSVSKIVGFVILLSLEPELPTFLEPRKPAEGPRAKPSAAPTDMANATSGNATPTSNSSTLQAKEASQLHAAIVSKISSRPADENVLNQTRYSPLTHSPSAISLETKTSVGSLEEAKVQLGVWTAASHKRMGLLLGSHDRRIVTLPFLLAVEHDWKLFFACDGGGEDCKFHFRSELYEELGHAAAN